MIAAASTLILYARRLSDELCLRPIVDGRKEVMKRNDIRGVLFCWCRMVFVTFLLADLRRISSQACAPTLDRESIMNKPLRIISVVLVLTLLGVALGMDTTQGAGQLAACQRYPR